MRPLLLIAPALLAGTLVLAACEDGSNDIVARRSTPEGPTPALEGAAKTFYDLLAGGFDVRYRVEYRTSSPEGEELDHFVVYNTDSLTRIDSVPFGSPEPSSLLIGRDEETDTVGCTNPSTGWECVRIEPLGYSLLALAGPNVLPTIWDVGASEVVATEPRTIAEQDATCYRVTGEEAVERAEYCLSAQGVPLFTASTSGVVEAESYSAEVNDGDLAPPAEPQG